MINDGVEFFVKVNQAGIDSGSGWGLCWGSIKKKANHQILGEMPFLSQKQDFSLQ